MKRKKLSQRYPSKKTFDSSGKKRITRLILSIIIAGTFLFCLLYVGAWLFTIPAKNRLEKKIDAARVALDAARKVHAGNYAPQLMNEANALWEDALGAWRLENGKWIFERRYSRVIAKAEDARKKAEDASGRASVRFDSLRNFAGAEIAALENSINELKGHFRDIPMSKTLRTNLTKSELLLTQCTSAYKRGDYLAASEHLKKIRQYSGQYQEAVTKKVDDYVSNIPLWKKWADETIRWSASHHDISLIVNKMDHRCIVYKGGKSAIAFAIELGPNWMGHKLVRGDKATPEGHYFITRKKGHGQTKYYLALELNYPNERDRRLLAAAKKSGKISTSQPAGGLIEIHGNGGKGADWTEGCVALPDKDMQKLFSMVRVGTPVTIIGTLENRIPGGAD